MAIPTKIMYARPLAKILYNEDCQWGSHITRLCNYEVTMLKLMLKHLTEEL